jgi:predicted glycosyltransferase involved in capsule biosynthesis
MSKPVIIIPVQVTSKEFLIFLRHLNYSLESIKKQTATCDTIIVDFMSAKPFIKPLQEIVKRFGMTYLREDRLDKKFGNCFSRGRSINAGVRYSDGDPLFFVDSDCVLPPRYIELNLQYINDKAITYSPFYDTTRKIRKSGNYRALMKQKRAIVGLRPGSYSHIGVPRSWINTYGAFNEEYVGWGGEDDDLIYRFKRTGMKRHRLTTHPIHLWHPTWEELMRKTGKDKVQRETLRANRARYYKMKGQKVKKIKTTQQ